MLKNKQHNIIHIISGVVILALTIVVIMFSLGTFNNAESQHSFTTQNDNLISQNNSLVSENSDLISQNNSLISENDILKDVSKDLAKRMHYLAEDLFSPFQAYGGESHGVHGDWNSDYELKVSKLKRKYSDLELDFPESFYSEDKKYIVSGLVKIENYEEVCNDSLTSDMKLKLNSMREFIFEYEDSEHPEYNGLYAQTIAKWYDTYYISSEYELKGISPDRLEYNIISKYGNKENRDTEVTTETKTFVLAKENGKWLIADFESSMNYISPHDNNY